MKKYDKDQIEKLVKNIPETKKCTKCEEILPTIDNFNIQKQGKHYYFTSNCKKCLSKAAYSVEKEKKQKNPIKGYAQSSWRSVNQRACNGVYSQSKSIQSSPQMVSYHKKGTEIHITKEEWYDFWEDNRELVLNILKLGLTPSVDRINSLKHYTLDNIRIISREKNMMIRFSDEYEELPEEDFKKIVKMIDDKIRETNRLAYLRSQNQGEK